MTDSAETAVKDRWDASMLIELSLIGYDVPLDWQAVLQGSLEGARKLSLRLGCGSCHFRKVIDRKKGIRGAYTPNIYSDP